MTLLGVVAHPATSFEGALAHAQALLAQSTQPIDPSLTTDPTCASV